MVAGGALGVAVFGGLVTVMWGDDIMRHNLDPKVPFQTYVPPSAPDYKSRASWYLNPAFEGREVQRNRNPQKLDAFFIHGTSFNGGKDWLGGIDDPLATAEVLRVQLPNHAGPFASIGYVYAPKYRQASLYSQLTQREDAREAREFAYGDVNEAFSAFLRQRRNAGGFIIVGVEQGGLIAQRLVQERVATDEALRGKLVAAYFMETLVPKKDYAEGKAIPACLSRPQIGCVVSYLSVDAGRPDRALTATRRAMVWDPVYALEPLGKLEALCVNPLNGAESDESVEARHSLGAANATGLEWGAVPALISRKVGARCNNGILYVNKPSDPSFKVSGSWADKKKVRSYNLFYGDLQADVAERWFNYRFAPKTPQVAP